MLTPEAPARSVGRPLGSTMKWALPIGTTSNCGVPDAKVSFSVSPSAAADAMAGAVAEADGAAGHNGDAAPDGVQVSATGLDVAGAGCPFALLAAAQAHMRVRARIKVVRRMPIGCSWAASRCTAFPPPQGGGSGRGA